MQIELTEEMKAEIIKQVSDQLLKEARGQMKAKVNEIAESVRSQVLGKLTTELAGEFHKKLNQSDIVNRTLQAAEDKFNARIKQTLNQGVTLQIKLGDGKAKQGGAA